jgi:hypothetical protein
MSEREGKDAPDFRAQFRERNDTSKTEHAYMGGTTIGCGDHPSTPKRHRWSKVRIFKTQRGEFRDRMCLNCGLTKGADE